MKKSSASKDVQILLSGGILDARSPAGEAGVYDFRALLNVATSEDAGKARMGGWGRWGLSEAPSNEDLHDQLLGAQGTVEGDVFTNADGQREAITLLREATSSRRVPYLIAGTKSRLYAATGSGRNWRLIADGLGGPYTSGESKWHQVQPQMAQLGDYTVFTNDVDAVLAWQLGGPVIETGYNASKRWACFEIPELLVLGITRAGCICQWNGFLFIADVVQDNERIGSQVSWSDINKPLGWAPGGESLAGYVDLGRGERVLAMAPLGGGLRCYTDRAIYSVELIGGDAVFLFREIYRGDLSLAYKKSFINLGDTHMWWTQDSVVVLTEYDKSPRRYEWMHKAIGFVFRGLDGRLLSGCPIEFEGFNPLDKTRCHQIAVGYDEILGNVWYSWPTKRASDETPDDPDDFDGVRRITLVMNPRYAKATLVDHGFSAFSNARASQWQTVRDFMVQQGVCSTDDVASDSALLGQKEGAPLNTHTPPDSPPTCIWNETEDPTLPMSDNSVSAGVCSMHPSIDCNGCSSEELFAMASTSDLSIKAFDATSRLRQVYDLSTDTTYAPVNSESFPNVLSGSYSSVGYPTLIQGECSKYGKMTEKTITNLSVVYDAETQTTPGAIYAQLGVSNSPHCMDWHSADAVTLDCLRDGVDGETYRAQPLATFPFFNAGSWVSYRLFIGGSEANDYAPQGCRFAASEITMLAILKNETWTNQ